MHEDLNPPSVVRVMGIDPSTTNMGVCVVDVDIKTRKPFELVYANTIYGREVIYDVPVQFDDLESTGVAARSFCLARSLGMLIDVYQPNVGICEDNFLGMSALTFKQLIQFVSLVRESFNNRDIHLSYVLPNLAKATVGANFKGTQKEDVQKGVIAYDWLLTKDIDLTLADEHTVDATAVTLYRCEQIANHYNVGRGSQ